MRHLAATLLAILTLSSACCDRYADYRRPEIAGNELTITRENMRPHPEFEARLDELVEENKWFFARFLGDRNIRAGRQWEKWNQDRLFTFYDPGMVAWPHVGRGGVDCLRMSPSKTKLLWLRFIYHPDETLGTELVLFDLERRLRKVVLSGHRRLLDPQWSPDGAKVALVSYLGGPGREQAQPSGVERQLPILEVVDVRTGERRELAEVELPTWYLERGTYWRPLLRWAPDGESLFLPWGDQTVVQVDASTGTRSIFEYAGKPVQFIGVADESVYYLCREEVAYTYEDIKEYLFTVWGKPISGGEEAELFTMMASWAGSCMLSPCGRYLMVVVTIDVPGWPVGKLAGDLYCVDLETKEFARLWLWRAFDIWTVLDEEHERLWPADIVESTWSPRPTFACLDDGVYSIEVRVPVQRYRYAAVDQYVEVAPEGRQARLLPSCTVTLKRGLGPSRHFLGIVSWDEEVVFERQIGQVQEPGVEASVEDIEELGNEQYPTGKYLRLLLYQGPLRKGSYFVRFNWRGELKPQVLTTIWKGEPKDFPGWEAVK